MIDPKYVASWMNYIRNYPEDKRFLECFWESQMKSKKWLINEVEKILPAPDNVIIFGGWYGVLAQMIESNFNSLQKITSLDIDPICAMIGDQLTFLGDNKIYFRTMCMAEYAYIEEYDCIINTSAEHVEQEIYDRWFRTIPTGKLVVVQSNNFSSIEEHIRCSSSLEDFLTMNHITDPLYHGKIDCGGFDRYMAIFRK